MICFRENHTFRNGGSFTKKIKTLFFIVFDEFTMYQAVRRTLSALTNMFLITSIRSRHCHHLLFINEGTDVQKGHVACNSFVVKLGSHIAVI